MALFDVLDGLGAEGGGLLDEGLVGGETDGLLGGEFGEEVALFPAGMLGEFAENDEFADGLETEDAEGARDDNPLDLLVVGGDAVKGLETVEGSLTAGGLARKHASDSAPEDHAGSGQMEGTATRIGTSGLVLKVSQNQLVPTKRTRHIQAVATNHSHRLT